VFSNGAIDNDGINDRDILLTIDNQRAICLDDDLNDHEPVETQFEATYCMETIVQELPSEDNNCDQNARSSNYHHHHHDVEVTTKRKLCDDSFPSTSPPNVDVDYSSVIVEASELKRARMEVDLEEGNELGIPIDDPTLPTVDQLQLVSVDLDPIMLGREKQYQERQQQDDVPIKELEKVRTLFVGQEEDQDAATLPQDITVAADEDDPKPTLLNTHAAKHDEDVVEKAETKMEEQLSVEDMQSTQLPANYKFLFDDEDEDDDDGSSLQSITSNAVDMIENIEPSNIGSSSSTTKSEEFVIVKSGNSVENSLESQK